jgi:hypothetical protein
MRAVSCGRPGVDADLPVDPPVELGSIQAYRTTHGQELAMMAIHGGCSEDQVFGVVVNGIDRATAARESGRRKAKAAPVQHVPLPGRPPRGTNERDTTRGEPAAPRS